MIVLTFSFILSILFKMLSSTLNPLESPRHHRKYITDRVQAFCMDFQSPLLARDDLAAASHLVTREPIPACKQGLCRWNSPLAVCQAL